MGSSASTKARFRSGEIMGERERGQKGEQDETKRTVAESNRLLATRGIAHLPRRPHCVRTPGLFSTFLESGSDSCRMADRHVRGLSAALHHKDFAFP